MTFKRTYTDFWSDYELLDAGGGKKLERFGNIVLIRPDLQAYFKSELPFGEWRKIAHAEFIEKSHTSGHWEQLNNNQNKNWSINLPIDNVKVGLQLTQFKHVGLFPEQAINWDFISKQLNEKTSFLNLFAYTGAASLVARKTGSAVTHVDSVKQLVSWSKSNMELSQLSDIRWIVDDALRFAQKEVQRGKKYDGIIMDPPAFGHGAKGEKWFLEKQLPSLIENASKLLNKNGFLIINTYSPRVNASLLEKQCATNFPKAKVSISELWMNSKTEKELYYGLLTKVLV